MEQREFLFRALDALEQASIPYAITGSWASTAYGMPRTTHDIDFWPLKDDAYSREQFARRRQVEVFGRKVWMLAPEDIILAKLLWYKMSESETQMRDMVGVWKAQRETLDLNYLRAWASRLSVANLLSKVTSS